METYQIATGHRYSVNGYGVVITDTDHYRVAYRSESPEGGVTYHQTTKTAFRAMLNNRDAEYIGKDES
jgi:hypothetical protein